MALFSKEGSIEHWEVSVLVWPRCFPKCISHLIIAKTLQAGRTVCFGFVCLLVFTMEQSLKE